MNKLILIALLPLAFAGCRTPDEVEKLRSNPEVTTVANVDGCTTKYVDRGTENTSFYQTSCPAKDVVSDTRNWTEKNGKVSEFKTRTDVTISDPAASTPVGVALPSQTEKEHQEALLQALQESLAAQARVKAAADAMKGQ